jgi:hypothetical protein
MVVRYTNTYGDALVFATVHNLRSIPLLGFLLAGAVVIVWLSFPDDVHGFPAVVAFAVVTLGVFFALLAFQLLFNAYWFASNRDKNFVTEHSVELTDSAFIESTAFTRTEIKWPGIFHVCRYLNRLFIFEGPNKGNCIPARAFPGRPEFEAFSNEAMKSWRRAK